MSAKHTPGPWSVPHFARPEVDCDCVYVLAEGYMGSIADVSINNGKSVSNGGNDAPPLEEAKANSRLIAAAPELYAALKTIINEDLFHAAANRAPFPAGRVKTLDAIYDAARAALAKVES